MRRRRVTLEQAVIRAALAHAERMADEGLSIGPDTCDWSNGLGRWLNETEMALLDAARSLWSYLPTEVADSRGKWVEGSPETSQHAALTVVRGKLGRQILGHIRSAHWHDAIGSTDDAMEAMLNRSHQSLSSARNALCEGGWLMDSTGDQRHPARQDLEESDMTADEAAVVQRIANEADSFCGVCAGELRDELKKAFPEHAAIFDAAYRERYS